MLLGNKVKKIFLTGGAGFIGSHVLDMLLPQGYEITVFDNLSNGKRSFIEPHMDKSSFNFIEEDAKNYEALREAMQSHDLVWHLAANTDIIGSHDQPARDFRDCAEVTFNVLESMRTLGIKPLLFASTGAVYGDLCQHETVSESSGPLLPVSTYGAGKIASEAFISSYCSVYGLEAWMFRFGNVIGARMTHGVIFDFINKLKANPEELLIRGDGRQEKNYFLVEECIEGMCFAFREIELSEDEPVALYNLGTTTTTKVVDIAHVIKEELGTHEAKITIEGSKKAWPGDQPIVRFTPERINNRGWSTRLSSDQSVMIATKRMLGKLGPLEIS